MLFQLMDITFDKKKLLISLGNILLTIIFILFLYLIDYKCPFYYHLHIWCGGCGGMRMLKALVNLEFYQAFRYNQLLFVLFWLSIIYLIINIFVYIKKKAIYIPSYRLLTFILVVAVVFMIIRNIPYFNYFIPTKV